MAFTIPATQWLLTPLASPCNLRLIYERLDSSPDRGYKGQLSSLAGKGKNFYSGLISCTDECVTIFYFFSWFPIEQIIIITTAVRACKCRCRYPHLKKTNINKKKTRFQTDPCRSRQQVQEPPLKAHLQELWRGLIESPLQGRSPKKLLGGA